MNEYVIGRCSRRCRILDRPLEPGERFYSVAVPKNGEILRYDIAESEWKGPPPDAIGWWRGIMDMPSPRRLIPASNNELVEKLGQLCEVPDQQTLAHLLGVLLVRRRVLQPDCDEADQEGEQPSHQTLVHPASLRKFIVPIVEPESTILQEIQESLHGLLYTEG